MAIHDDILPKLNEERKALQDAGKEFEADQLLVRITEENDKRAKWAVSTSIFNNNEFNSLKNYSCSWKVVCEGTITWDSSTLSL